MAVRPDYRFGPFEVYTDAGALVREGKRVRLQEQPFRLLVILLERPGEIVPRVDLQKRIWPANTFVDFDSSLRVAVRKLRDALGDDAEKPRYIETIPRVGYRFLGPAIHASGSLGATDPAPPPASDEAAFPQPVTASSSSRYGGKKLWYVAGLLAAIASAGWWLVRSRPEHLGAFATVVIADFENTTGQPVFDETLRQGLMVELAQSPFVNILPEERMQQQLKLMGQPSSARLTPVLAREVCQRVGGSALLEGSIASIGNHYVLGLRASDCRTGRFLAQEQAEASSMDDVLLTLSSIARRTRRRVGESLESIHEHDTPLPEATTSSLEALKAYSTGLRTMYASGDADALPLFQRATEIDPNFAMAFAHLGLVYGSIGESDLSAENTRRAYELRDRTSDAERYFITASWDARVTGNALKAQKTCEAWARAYPREVIPHAYLAGFLYPSTANYEKAVEEAKTALDLRQDMAILYVIDAYDEMALGRQHAAEDILRQAGQQKLETPESAVLRYDLAFLTDGQPEREISAADATFGGDWLVYHQAAALAYAGRLRQGLSLSLRAEQMAKQAGHPETAAIYRTGSALWQALDGDLPGARRDAMAALQLSRDREVLYGAGLALAFSGQGMQSRLIAREVLQRFPEDTAVQFSYVPVMKAALALSQGAPATALEALEMTRPYELATQRSTIHGDFGALYPVYLRGQAYLLAHRGAEAVVEFRKICDHRGIVLTDPVGAMAWLQLGRAHAMTGDRIAARADYETFFKQWSSADAAVPVNRQARHEFTAMGTAVR